MPIESKNLPSRPDTRVICLRGELNFDLVNSLHQLVEEILADNNVLNTIVVFDYANKLDKSFLVEILKLNKIAHQRGGESVWAQLNENAFDDLVVKMGFDNVIKIFNSLEEAIQNLS